MTIEMPLYLVSAWIKSKSTQRTNESNRTGKLISMDEISIPLQFKSISTSWGGGGGDGGGGGHWYRYHMVWYQVPPT